MPLKSSTPVVSGMDMFNNFLQQF